MVVPLFDELASELIDLLGDTSSFKSFLLGDGNEYDVVGMEVSSKILFGTGIAFFLIRLILWP